MKDVQLKDVLPHGNTAYSCTFGGRFHPGRLAPAGKPSPGGVSSPGKRLVQAGALCSARMAIQRDISFLLSRVSKSTT